jgi:putative membrane protein
MSEIIKTDLILREKLAIQRTILANQTTFLAFTRTSMYFLVAGVSIDNLLKFDYKYFITNSFYVISFILIATGLLNFIVQKRKIKDSEKHIGGYKTEFENKSI